MEHRSVIRIIGISAAAIAVLGVLFGIGMQPSLVTQEKNVALNSAGIKPTVTNVIPKESVTGPQTFVVKPTTSISNSISTTAKFILPLIHSAFAITPTQNPVTSTEWTVPTASSNPLGVSVDSSGNVFFAESNGNKMGRLVPSTSTITEWTVPTASSIPSGVSVDSSGNVFFTENGGNNIGKLVPSTNVITEWTVPTASSGVAGASVDSSGNVFFTEGSGNKVGRLVPSTSVITEWTVPTASSAVSVTAVDPSGNVFFSEQAANKIGRLS
ncbi:MAG: hypothetical protein E6K83_08095 [Thaumarchaeota archaeon]|nr:MAG: hypothetical protein E6K83_08095 [Nitrososphaerota archaeon]